MINQHTAAKAAQISGALADNVVLGVEKDSLLAELISTVVSLPETEFDPQGGVVADAANIKTDDVVLHSIALDKLSEKVKDSVLPLLHLVRNLVIPDYRGVVEYVQESMSSMEADISSTLGYQLEYVQRDPLIMHESILEEMEKYHSVLSTSFSGMRVLVPSFTKDLVLAACKSNNEQVSKLVEDKVDATYEQLENLFSNMGEYKALSQDALVLAYMVCTYIYDSPAEGVNYSLTDYNQTVIDLKQQIGGMIHRVQSKWLHEVERGILFTGVREGKVIKINVEVLANFSSDSGKITPEVIFANERLGRASILARELLEKSEYLTNVFHTESKLMAVEFDNRLNDHMRMCLRTGINRLIASKGDDELPAPRDMLIDRLANAVNKLTHAEISNLAYTARDLVCYLLYPHSGALDLIKSSDHLACENPDMDLRDTFSLATIEYIAKWVSGQVLSM